MARPANPNLRDALIAAARAEFAEQGLEKARVEDITRRAGASKGAFYLHFQSKDEVFELVARGFIDGLVHGLWTADELSCGTERLPTAELLRRELEHDLVLMRFLWDERDVFRMIMEGSVGTPLHARLRNALVQGMLDHFASAFQRHAELGCGPRLDPNALSLVLTGSLLMVMWQMVQRAVPDDFRTVSITVRRLFTSGAYPPDLAAAMSLALEQVIADLRVEEAEAV